MRRLAWASCAASVAMLAAGWGLLVAAGEVAVLTELLVSGSLVAFPVVGALIATRRPANRDRSRCSLLCVASSAGSPPNTAGRRANGAIPVATSHTAQRHREPSGRPVGKSRNSSCGVP